MSCNCIKDIKEKYTEAATKQLGVEAEVEVEGVVWPIVDGELKTTLSVPLRVTADVTGYRRGKVQKLLMTYCPFCGVKAFDPKEESKDE